MAAIRDPRSGTDEGDDMEDPWRTPSAQDSFESCVTVEMRGPNVVVRSTSGIDRAGTEGLAHLINAAVATELAVVIDPEQLRCSDAVVSVPVPVADLRCRRHHGCRKFRLQCGQCG